jgi:hypothetical protein
MHPLFFKPCGFGQRLALWTVTVSARVVTDPAMAAVIARIHVAAECGRSAHFDRMHDPPLFRVHSVGMFLPVRWPMQTENVGYFKGRPVHGCSLKTALL